MRALNFISEMTDHEGVELSVSKKSTMTDKEFTGFEGSIRSNLLRSGTYSMRHEYLNIVGS